MHTLFQGMVAAFISAAVALVVLMVTVRAQNKGIQRQIAVQQESLRTQIAVQQESLRTQLEVQERSVAEQLRVQRHENSRDRELATVGRMLTVLNDWSDEQAKGEMTTSQSHDYFKARLSELIVGFEELRINGHPSTDISIDCFKSFAFHMREATKDQAYKYDGRYRHAGVVAFYFERFLITHLVRYARMDLDERIEMNSFLTTALADFDPWNLSPWVKTYMTEIMSRHRR